MFRNNENSLVWAFFWSILPNVAIWWFIAGESNLLLSAGVNLAIAGAYMYTYYRIEQFLSNNSMFEKQYLGQYALAQTVQNEIFFVQLLLSYSIVALLHFAQLSLVNVAVIILLWVGVALRGRSDYKRKLGIATKINIQMNK